MYLHVSIVPPNTVTLKKSVQKLWYVAPISMQNICCDLVSLQLGIHFLMNEENHCIRFVRMLNSTLLIMVILQTLRQGLGTTLPSAVQKNNYTLHVSRACC